jgi:hypothetical protein
MRSISLFAASIVVLGLSQAGAQPQMRNMDPAVATTSSASYDDLNCAARYTLAAFVIQGLDATAAAYYSERATDAGKRYLALHPGESEQAYSARVTANAQDIQTRLATNTITPEGLVSEIKQCDQAADTRMVM